MNKDNEKMSSKKVNPERIAHLLTRAAQRLDDNTVAALHQAREFALERQLQRKPVSILSAGHGMQWLMPHSPHQWVAMVILLATIVFGAVDFWQHAHEVELARLDAAILTDDMPLEVFVDNYPHQGQ